MDIPYDCIPLEFLTLRLIRPKPPGILQLQLWVLYPSTGSNRGFSLGVSALARCGSLPPSVLPVLRQQFDCDLTSHRSCGFCLFSFLPVNNELVNLSFLSGGTEIESP